MKAKMKKYKVYIWQEVFRSATITVEACSVEDAGEKALDMDIPEERFEVTDIQDQGCGEITETKGRR